MNIIRIAGGIGNQIYQYAFGRAQEIAGRDVRFTPPWQGWKFPHPRQYRLNMFHTKMKYSEFLSQTKITERTHQRKYKVKYDLKLLERCNCNFEGYWQYLPYYKDILPQLKKELCIKEEFYTTKFLKLREEITDNNSVSIHVRRTDFVGAKAYQAFPFAYYVNAIRMIKGHLYIFSDDIPWCKDVFKKDYFSRKITFVHSHDYLDFELMRLCKHNISANSSFSYWASLLNNNPNKTVIISGRWLVDIHVDNEEVHFPKEWIKL